jgi:hypothetical protein
MQTRLQEAAQNEATAKILNDNPAIMKVLQNRAQFFQRQIQQTENAKIGRLQVTQTFGNQAAQPAIPLGA